MLYRNHIILGPDEIPQKWYNLVPDLPSSPSSYQNSNREKIHSLPNIFTRTSSILEFSKKKWINIPEEVIDAYIRCGRPTTLIRANRLEDFLKTCAKIYYKCEYLNPVGTFKTNAALPQAYWAMTEGCERTVFAGSSSTRTKYSHAFSANYYGLTPIVFVSRDDANNNPKNIKLLEMLNTDIQIVPIKKNENKNHMEFVRESVIKEATEDRAAAVISSFLNHVLLTQTVMGLEAEQQLNAIDEKPDIVVAPVGGGSNFFGVIAPFLRKKIRDKNNIQFLAVESETSAKLTHGHFDYIRLQSPASDIFAKTYNYEMETPRPKIMGIGIQTSNTAPLVGHLRNQGYINTVVYPRDEKDIFEAARIFLQTEGHLIAPESAYAVKAAIDESLKAKKENREKVILVSISATSYMDLGEKQRYHKYLSKLP